MFKQKPKTIILSLVATIAMLTPSLSAIAQDYNPNNIISDSTFTNVNTMSINDIQRFLEQKNSLLATASPATLGVGANGMNAATIIYYAATGTTSSGAGVTVHINPQVLLATLQKEQSLITLSAENYDAAADSQGRLRKATGYACPDSGGCDVRYEGFFNQVNMAGWQLAWNKQRSYQSGTYDDFQVGRTYTYTNTGAGYANPCDNNNPIPSTTTVTHENGASAALFRYTPHWVMGNCNFSRIYKSFFEGATTYSHPAHKQEIAVVYNASSYDQDVEVFQAPEGETHTFMTGKDYWEIPKTNNIEFTAGADIDNDGYKELAVLRQTSKYDYDLYVHEAPQGSEHQAPIAIDKWNAPTTTYGETIIDMTGADINGDGDDELAILKRLNGHQTLYFYDVFPGTQMFRLVAMDAWNITEGGNVKQIAAADINGDNIDEIITLKQTGHDQDILIYERPTGYSKEESGQLIAGDKWVIPANNNITDMAVVDNDGDGTEELVTLHGNHDKDISVWDIPITLRAANDKIGWDNWNIPSRGNNIVGIAGVR